jgi:hypothetical protein
MAGIVFINLSAFRKNIANFPAILRDAIFPASWSGVVFAQKSLVLPRSVFYKKENRTHTVLADGNLSKRNVELASIPHQIWDKSEEEGDLIDRIVRYTRQFRSGNQFTLFVADEDFIRRHFVERQADSKYAFANFTSFVLLEDEVSFINSGRHEERQLELVHH